MKIEGSVARVARWVHGHRHDQDVEAPKSAPSEAAAQALDGLEAGDQAVLADDTARQVKPALAGPPSSLYPAVG